MINVMLDPLPTEWNGYKLNTDFRIGVQIFLAQYDKEMNDFDKQAVLLNLLFEEITPDGKQILRPHPTGKELNSCVEFYLDGWYHDKKLPQKEKLRCMDFDTDQWRIYADFIQIYHIDLSTANLHWWAFCGLLWNMPRKQSSFLQVIEIRKKKITSKMKNEERKVIKEAQQLYAVEQPEVKKEYTSEEEAKIDAFDKIMEQRRKNKELADKFME